MGIVWRLAYRMAGHMSSALAPSGSGSSGSSYSASITGKTSNPTHGLVAQDGVELTGVITGLVGGETVVHRWFAGASQISGEDTDTFTPVIGDNVADLDLIKYSPTVDSVAVDSATVRVRHVPPVAAGGLDDVSYNVGDGDQTVDASVDFTGEALSYSAVGATVNSSTGAVTIETDEEAAGVTVTVTATNSGGVASTSFDYSVAALDPRILTQPQIVNVEVGETVEFTVVAGGTSPFTYQWQERIGGDWEDMTDEDADTLTFTATEDDDGREFRVVVTNALGSIASAVSSSGVDGGGGRPLQPRRAVNFPGPNGYINYGGLFETGDFSVSFWVYIPSLVASCGFVGQGDTYDTGTGFAVYTNSSGNVFALLVRGGTRVFASRSGVTQGAWHHVAVTVNRAGNMTVYVDGVAGTPVSVTGVTGSIANGGFFAGRYGNSSTYLPGRMFDLQVFSSVLTAGNVTALKDYGPYAIPAIARRLWSKLDDQNTTKTYDSSGNGTDGTLHNVNATVGNFFYEGADVPHSYQNSVGYTLDGAVYVPRDESDVTKDVDGNTLQFAGPFSYVSATGGTVTTDGAYTVHTFTSSGDFIASVGGDIEYLCVAGGGGGGWRNAGVGGAGGGAGGLLAGSAAISAGTIAITIGAGGSGGNGGTLTAPSSGSNSVIAGLATSIGGGRGGCYNYPSANGASGGSGGGGAWGAQPTFGVAGAGTVGQGNSGGTGQNVGGAPGGGGGGAGAAGANASAGGAGGVGLQSSISGTAAYYAGGGGGISGAAGGLGGGGGGANPGTAGTANTGGGGGGTTNNVTGGNGGSGVVIIRYLS